MPPGARQTESKAAPILTSVRAYLNQKLTEAMIYTDMHTRVSLYIDVSDDVRAKKGYPRGANYHRIGKTMRLVCYEFLSEIPAATESDSFAETQSCRRTGNFPAAATGISRGHC